MSNINNQTKDLFAITLVNDLDNETAAACRGGEAYLYGPDPDVILYKEPTLQGESLNANATIGDGFSDLSFVSGNWNDTISSVSILRGTWNFYQHDNRGGYVTTLGPGNYYFGLNNDAISSFYREG